jgi:Uma2 family endonuclease
MAGIPLFLRDYLNGPEEMGKMELVWGSVMREPAPRWGHQEIIKRATIILELHVRARGLGVVGVSPIDVVLDRDRFLVVQPDLVFIANDRRHIIKDQVWGPPDVVIEVLSRRTAQRDRAVKSVWYRDYGVKECWLIDPDAFDITIHDFVATPLVSRTFSGDELVVSNVLPDLNEKAAQFFD